MGIFTGVAKRLKKSSEKPVVRMKGFWKSSRYLLLHFPLAADCSMTMIPYCDLKAAKFSIERVGENDLFVLKLKDKVISEIGSHATAVHVMGMITDQITPSKWRFIRRAALLIAIYLIISPSAPSVSTQPIANRQIYPQSGSVPRPMPPASVQQQQQYQQQRQQDIAAPLSVSPNTTGQAATNDPFGLKISPTK
jgi:hypothetical protein